MVDLMGAHVSDWWGNYRVLKTNMDPNGAGSVKVTGGSFRDEHRPLGGHQFETPEKDV